MFRQWLGFLLLVWVLSAPLCTGSEVQDAIQQFVQRQDANIRQVQLLHRSSVAPDLDLVVTLGYPKELPIQSSNKGWWSDRSKLGIFLQRSSSPTDISLIALELGKLHEDCSTGVERVTRSEVVLICAAEKSSLVYRKFVYSIAQKKMVKQMAYQPFAIRDAYDNQGRLIFRATNGKRSVFVEYQASAKPPFQLLSEQSIQSMIPVVPSPEVYSVPDLKPVHFGKEKEFSLVRDDPHEYAVWISTSSVVEGQGGTAKKYSFPRTTNEMSIERIGPRQVVNDTLWFAKSFSAGEGFAGMGGFGYFDLNTRQYQIFSPEWIQQRSATALLVEPDSIWLGLAHEGEWGSSGFGVVRYDRATEKIDQLKLGESEIVWNIRRAGKQLIITTEIGMALYDGNQLRRFFIDETTDGRLRIVEALPGFVSRSQSN